MTNSFMFKKIAWQFIAIITILREGLFKNKNATAEKRVTETKIVIDAQQISV